MKKQHAVDALSALGHETRLDIYRLLVKAGPDGLTASDIAAKVGVSASSLTFHIGHLERAGLVQSRREGRWIFYSADFGAMSSLVDYLTQDCCGGHPEVCGTLATSKEQAS